MGALRAAAALPLQPRRVMPVGRRPRRRVAGVGAPMHPLPPMAPPPLVGRIRRARVVLVMLLLCGVMMLLLMVLVLVLVLVPLLVGGLIEPERRRRPVGAWGRPATRANRPRGREEKPGEVGGAVGLVRRPAVGVARGGDAAGGFAAIVAPGAAMRGGGGRRMLVVVAVAAAADARRDPTKLLLLLLLEIPPLMACGTLEAMATRRAQVTLAAVGAAADTRTSTQGHHPGARARATRDEQEIRSQHRTPRHKNIAEVPTERAGEGAAASQATENVQAGQPAAQPASQQGRPAGQPASRPASGRQADTHLPPASLPPAPLLRRAVPILEEAGESYETDLTAASRRALGVRPVGIVMPTRGPTAVLML